MLGKQFLVAKIINETKVPGRSQNLIQELKIKFILQTGDKKYDFQKQ